MEDDTPHTVALTLSYCGTPFAGFARQPEQLTVQGSLEEALALLYRRPVGTTGAGRTDAGVHARGQVVSFEVSSEELEAHPPDSLRRSLNALIDEHAAVRDVQEMPGGFSARFDATAREYRYFICEDAARPVLLGGRVWHLGRRLDIEEMRAGALHLIGEHDFKSFCLAASARGKPTCREVSEIDIVRTDILGEPVVVLKIVGNAFLHSMVRAIVGTLVAVGLHRRDPGWVSEVLEAKDRQAAGENAPAQGLVFWNVQYGGRDKGSPAAGKRGTCV